MKHPPLLGSREGRKLVQLIILILVALILAFDAWALLGRNTVPTSVGISVNAVGIVSLLFSLTLNN